MFAARRFQAQTAELIAFIIDKYTTEMFRECVDLLMGSGIPYMYLPKKNPSVARSRKSFSFLIFYTEMRKDFRNVEEFEASWKSYVEDKRIRSEADGVAE